MKKKKKKSQPRTHAEKEYQIMKEKLLSPSTSSQELAAICMTLAHEPEKEALTMLTAFKASDRAKEVIWLDMAIEEAKYWSRSPTK